MTGPEPQKWFAADVLVDPDATEAVESAFNVLDALGTEIDSLGKGHGEPLIVSGYFDSLPADDKIETAVRESLAIYAHHADSLKSISTRAVEQTDWLAEWKKHWRPTEVGRFIIAPPWSEVDSGKIVIRIEPNMAFGTGTHETTQLCLRAIGDIYTPDMSLIDVGTGTGILAIAAAKLGGSSILACDTDIDSVRLAKENASANDVGERIVFFEGPIDEQTPKHDIVCANLTLDMIVPILSLLLAKTGSLLLSGILSEQENSIRDELKKRSITDMDVRYAGKWILGPY